MAHAKLKDKILILAKYVPDQFETDEGAYESYMRCNFYLTKATAKDKTAPGHFEDDNGFVFIMQCATDDMNECSICLNMVNDHQDKIEVYYDDVIGSDLQLEQDIIKVIKAVPDANLIYDKTAVGFVIGERANCHYIKASEKYDDFDASYTKGDIIKEGFMVAGIYSSPDPSDSGAEWFYSDIVHPTLKEAELELAEAQAKGNTGAEIISVRRKELNGYFCSMEINSNAVPEPIAESFEDDGEQLDGQDYGE